MVKGSSCSRGRPKGRLSYCHCMVNAAEVEALLSPTAAATQVVRLLQVFQVIVFSLHYDLPNFLVLSWQTVVSATLYVPVWVSHGYQ